ncbi:MAG: protein-disulfide reductase DsbD [Gammaproteobacteria bacterium]|nr:protein-disulfide reductase DsbD [Gammaproteobacteria bacterium]
MSKTIKFALAILLTVNLSLVFAQDEEELLEPEKAFATSAQIDENNTILLKIDIADGYYVYREKIKLVSKTDGVELGELVSPAGKIKEDEFFGKVETYRGTIDLSNAVTATNGLKQLDIEVTSQGCADLGICYPPMTLPFTLALNDTAQSSGVNDPGAQSAESAQNVLTAGFGSDEEFLDPDVAFVPEIRRVENGQIDISWTIADDYYLYKDKFAFELSGGEGATLGVPSFNKGEIKDDPFFGRIEVYHHNADASVPLHNVQATGQGTLKVSYQGCAEAGICYPPMSKELPVSWSFISSASAAEPANAVSAQTGQAPLSEQDQIAESLSKNSLWGIILSFFGLGLLLAFTPCVFPMIPILSSLIVGQGEQITTRKAFMLSVVYVLAMALTYTVAGVIVGLSGENVQAIFQNPWVLSLFALLFVILSLSMFGFYELQMPSAIQSKLTAMSNRQQGGTLAGVAIMGFLSALIVGPCVTAPLVGALIYIAQTGDAVIGGLALFSLSIGMGIPLILIGVSAGKFLPRAGTWMNATKAVFGVMLLGLAIWMLERILPLYVIMAMAAVLVIASGVYMGALEPVNPEKSGWTKLWKSLGLILVLYGVLLLIGAASGGTGFMKPLKGVFASGNTSSGAAQSEHLVFKQIKGVDGLQRELDSARQAGQSVMLDFYADWCISCKEMEAYTFSDANVQAALSSTILLQTDVTANDEKDKALLKHFGLFGPPAIIFYDKSGNEQRNSRVVGYMKADEFASLVKRTVN